MNYKKCKPLREVLVLDNDDDLDGILVQLPLPTHIDDRVVIDAAVGGNQARFINHSCDPNCDAVIEDGRIWIETIRDVEAGEELAYDYAYVLAERHTPAAKRRFPCHCGAARCRGTILARKR